MQDFKPGLSDLMRKANRGDQQAYNELLRELVPVVRRMIRRGLPREAPVDAEDVLQDTLLAIHMKRHTWDESRPLLPWVHAVAKNKLADGLRRRHAMNIPIDEMSETLSVEPAATCEGMDVRRLLSHLSGRTREIVASISMDGASAREVAAKFRMSEVAVRVAYHRGITRVARAVAAR